MTDEDLLKHMEAAELGKQVASIQANPAMETVFFNLATAAFKLFSDPNADKEKVGTSRALALAIAGVKEEMNRVIMLGRNAEAYIKQAEEVAERERQRAEVGKRA